METRGEVLKEKTSLGFVDTVTKDGEGVSKVTLRIASAAQLTDQDRFVAEKDANGRTGVRVLPGQGRPLHDGDEITETFVNPLRQKLAMAPKPVTLPSGYYVPYPKALTFSPEMEIARSDRAFQQRLDRIFKDKHVAQGDVPSAERAKFNTLTQRIAALEPEEALRVLTTEGSELQKQLREASSQGNTTAEQRRNLVELQVSLRHAQKEAERAIRHQKHIGRHPVPPELQ